MWKSCPKMILINNIIDIYIYRNIVGDKINLEARVYWSQLTTSKINILLQQLQSRCKMYSCFCKSTKMYIQLRVPTYNHNYFVLHCCLGFSASARNDVTARASSWLVNAARISAKVQIFQLARFAKKRSIRAIRAAGLSFACLHWLNM